MSKIWQKLRAALKRMFCEHLGYAYDPPTLEYDGTGRAYVLTRSYCTECGKTQPIPAAYRMEHERRVNELVASAPSRPFPSLPTKR